MITNTRASQVWKKYTDPGSNLPDKLCIRSGLPRGVTRTKALKGFFFIDTPLPRTKPGLEYELAIDPVHDFYDVSNVF
jgi:hypothetical protein